MGKTKSMKTLGNIIFYIVAIIYTLISWGIVILVLWNWFIPPIFAGAPHITYFQALELALVVEAITYEPIYTPTREQKKIVTDSVATLLRPWFILLLGWIIFLAS